MILYYDLCLTLNSVFFFPPGDHEPGEDVEGAGHQEAVLPQGALAV